MLFLLELGRMKNLKLGNLNKEQSKHQVPTFIESNDAVVIIVFRDNKRPRERE